MRNKDPKRENHKQKKIEKFMPRWKNSQNLIIDMMKSINKY